MKVWNYTYYYNNSVFIIDNDSTILKTWDFNEKKQKLEKQFIFRNKIRYGEKK